MEFQQKLSGDRLEIYPNLPENYSVNRQEIIINWSMLPSVGRSGVSFWNIKMDSFEVNYDVLNGENDEQETIIFDGREYEMEINSDDYRMKDDLMIVKIEIDKIKMKAIAYLNGHKN